jgi:hypothetical protein
VTIDAIAQQALSEWVSNEAPMKKIDIAKIEAAVRGK